MVHWTAIQHKFEPHVDLFCRIACFVQTQGMICLTECYLYRTCIVIGWGNWTGLNRIHACTLHWDSVLVNLKICLLISKHGEIRSHKITQYPLLLTDLSSLLINNKYPLDYIIFVPRYSLGQIIGLFILLDTQTLRLGLKILKHFTKYFCKLLWLTFILPGPTAFSYSWLMQRKCTPILFFILFNYLHVAAKLTEKCSQIPLFQNTPMVLRIFRMLYIRR